MLPRRLPVLVRLRLVVLEGRRRLPRVLGARVDCRNRSRCMALR
jgi:hypothetical protein